MTAEELKEKISTLLAQAGLTDTSWAQTMLKSTQSKNIDIAEWNAFVYKVAELSNTADAVRQVAQLLTDYYPDLSSGSDPYGNPALGALQSRSSKALTDYSIALGYNLLATRLAQAVFGQYNEENDDALLIVGKGEDLGNDVRRSNAFWVDFRGIAYSKMSPWQPVGDPARSDALVRHEVFDPVADTVKDLSDQVSFHKTKLDSIDDRVSDVNSRLDAHLVEADADIGALRTETKDISETLDLLQTSSNTLWNQLNYTQSRLWGDGAQGGEIQRLEEAIAISSNVSYNNYTEVAQKVDNLSNAFHDFKSDDEQSESAQGDALLALTNRVGVLESAQPSSTKGLTYTVSYGIATCTGYNSDIYISNKELVIADEYHGYPVRHIAAAAFNGLDWDVDYVTLPKTLDTIGADAFADTSIKYVSIPPTVTSIGSNAFRDCPYLKSVHIPISVTTMGGGAFDRCTSLSIYTAHPSVPEGWDAEWNASNCPVYFSTYNVSVVQETGEGTEAVMSQKATTDALDGKLDKVTETYWCPRAYAVDANGTQNMVDYSTAPNAYSLAWRASNGTLAVGTPTAEHHAVPLGFADRRYEKTGTTKVYWSDVDGGEYIVTDGEYAFGFDVVSPAYGRIRYNGIFDRVVWKGGNHDFITVSGNENGGHYPDGVVLTFSDSVVYDTVILKFRGLPYVVGPVILLIEVI